MEEYLEESVEISEGTFRRVLESSLREVPEGIVRGILKVNFVSKRSFVIGIHQDIPEKYLVEFLKFLKKFLENFLYKIMKGFLSEFF